MELRIIKGEYLPKKTNYMPNEELVLIYHCMDKDGKRHDIYVRGTEPRFWTREHPDNVNMPEIDRKKIIKVVKSGKDLQGNQLYCIYTKFPFNVPELREYFNWHGQADVKYDDAAKIFYKHKAYISVDKTYCHVDDIKVLDDRQFDLNKGAWSFDIETEDENGFALPKHPTNRVICWTLTNHYTGDIIHATIAEKLDKKEVISTLRHQGKLQYITQGKVTPEPVKGKIMIKTFESMKMDDNDMLNDLEAQLLNYLYDVLIRIKPAIIFGWNIKFDIDYIRERIKVRKKYKYKFKDVNSLFSKMAIIDAMDMYDSITVNDLPSKSLDWCSISELGYGKVKHKNLGFSDMLKDEPELLSIYNIMDTILPIRINYSRNDMLNFYGNYTAFHGQYLENWYSNVAMIEMEVMMRLHPDTILPSKKFIVNKGVDAGGFVAKAPSGIFTKMFEVDNGQEYPSIIRTCNMGFRTKVQNICDICEYKDTCDSKVNSKLWKDCDKFKSLYPISKVPSGRCYRLDIEDIMPTTLARLSDERNAIKKEMKKYPKNNHQYKVLNDRQTIRKYAMNAWYGVLGNPHFRLGDGEIGSDITEIARLHINWNKDYIERMSMDYNGMELKFNVIYQDTDSCKVVIDKSDMLNYDDIKNIGHAVANRLQDDFDKFSKEYLNTDKHYLSVKYEDGYAVYYQWGVKKRYAYKNFDGYYTYKGLDIVRSSTSPITKEAQTIFINGILNLDDDDVTIAKIKDLIKDVRNGKWDSRSGRPIGYHSTNNWIHKIVEYSNKHLGKNFKLGDKPVLYYIRHIKDKPMPHNGIIALEWSDDIKDYNVKLDYDEIIDKFIYRPLDTIIGGLGYKTAKEWLDKRINVTTRGLI